MTEQVFMDLEVSHKSLLSSFENLHSALHNEVVNSVAVVRDSVAELRTDINDLSIKLLEQDVLIREVNRSISQLHAKIENTNIKLTGVNTKSSEFGEQLENVNTKYQTLSKDLETSKSLLLLPN